MEVADRVGTANLEEIITTWVMAGMASGIAGRCRDDVC